MTLVYAELADFGIGAVLLLLGVVVLKDVIMRGWMILTYMALQAGWAAFMLMYNLWTLDGWVLLVQVLWLAVLIVVVRFMQMGWKLQQRAIKRRDNERLRSILDSHERIDD